MISKSINWSNFFPSLLITSTSHDHTAIFSYLSSYLHFLSTLSSYPQVFFLFKILLFLFSLHLEHDRKQQNTSQERKKERGREKGGKRVLSERENHQILPRSVFLFSTFSLSHVSHLLSHFLRHPFFIDSWNVVFRCSQSQVSLEGSRSLSLFPS